MENFEYKINLHYFLQDLSDRDRLKLLKDVIDTAPDAQDFVIKIKKWLEKVEVD